MPTPINRIRTKHTTTPSSGPIQLGSFSRRVWENNQAVWLPVPSQTAPAVHTYAEIHPTEGLCVDSIHEGPPYKDGGQLKVLNLIRSDPYGGVYGNGVYDSRDGDHRYTGGFHAAEAAQFGLDMQISEIDVTNFASMFPSLDGMSNDAYNKSKPKLEKAGAAVFAAELRDLPRMLKTTSKGFHETWKALGGDQASRLMSPKRTADHFLNIQFGWMPFIKDLQKFDNVVQNAPSIISRISDDNGKVIRRRVALGDDRTHNLISSGTGFSLYPNSIFNGAWDDLRYWAVGKEPTYELWEDLHTHTYASGKFSFYRPEFDWSLPDHSSAWNSAMRHMTIAGARISPSNIYKAIPWTWAADWIVNVGDFVDHANDILVDSVACNYLYVMQTQTRTRTFIQKLPFISGNVTLEFTRTIETKQRQPMSSPFGPSLTWGSLSPRQLAIAAALGISRV